MIFGILKMLFSVVPNMIGKFAEGRKHKREMANAVAVKQLENVQEKGMVDANWEKESAAAAKDSWKDEFWTLIFGYLLLSSLWDPDQIKVVFETYKEAPQWFQLCVLVSVGSSFGVKIWKVLRP